MIIPVGRHWVVPRYGRNRVPEILERAKTSYASCIIGQILGRDAEVPLHVFDALVEMIQVIENPNLEGCFYLDFQVPYNEHATGFDLSSGEWVYGKYKQRKRKGGEEL